MRIIIFLISIYLKTFVFCFQKVFKYNVIRNDIINDIGARTIIQSGLDVDDIANFDAADPWWMEVVRGANAFTLSGGGAVTLTGRDKWL